MTRKLLIEALAKVMAGIALMALLLFAPAGTFAWREGWRLMAILFVPMILAGFVMMAKRPELLRKRLNSKETEKTQRKVVGLSALVFLLGFVLAGLDFRFGWTKTPGWLAGLASMLFLISYGLYAEVMRENAYLSRTIEVQAGQRVVDTGLYGIVRHPMYAATVLMFLSLPLVLGSWISLVVFLAYPALIAVRIRNEERVLLKGLTGYAAYMKKVRYRLIPFVW